MDANTANIEAAKKRLAALKAEAQAIIKRKCFGSTCLPPVTRVAW